MGNTHHTHKKISYHQRAHGEKFLSHPSPIPLLLIAYKHVQRHLCIFPHLHMWAYVYLLLFKWTAAHNLPYATPCHLLTHCTWERMRCPQAGSPPFLTAAQYSTRWRHHNSSAMELSISSSLLLIILSPQICIGAYGVLGTVLGTEGEKWGRCSKSV